MLNILSDHRMNISIVINVLYITDYRTSHEHTTMLRGIVIDIYHE